MTRALFVLLQGADGACIAKTNQCVLLGMYGELFKREIFVLCLFLFSHT